MITIYLQYKNDPIITINININESIESLKEKIKQNTNINFNNHRILLNNFELSDTKTLEDYKIENGEILIIQEIIEEKDDNYADANKIIIVNEKCEKRLINISFLTKENKIITKENCIELSALLKLCLLKYISRKIDPKLISKISSKELKEIITKLREDIEHKKSNEEEIKNILSHFKGNNLLEYSKYISQVINQNDIKDLVSIFNSNDQKDIKDYWTILSDYDKRNQLFEKNFRNDLRESFFDYCIVSLVIMERSDLQTFEEEKEKCKNTINRFLYHGTQIDPISKIMTNDFLFTRKAFYGMGIYFSDMLDYIGFYSGGETYEERRKNFGKIRPINSNIYLIATEIYYDKEKIKIIKDNSYLVPELEKAPTYSEIKSKYPDKMVEKNGIHFAEVEPYGGHCIKQIVKDNDIIMQDAFIKKEVKKDSFIGNEFVITEKDQFCPLYGLTLKRNEWCIIWRDPNFSGSNEFSNFLKQRRMFSNELAGYNFYFETNTEEALKLVFKKRHNKIIFITSVGLDLSGKKFIEVARKILNSQIIVLFFSKNKSHLDWIKQFPNALYTSTSSIFEEYLSSFNERGLKKLKETVEKEYKIKLKNFTNDFIKYPLFVNEGKYSQTDFNKFCPYIREVWILNENSNKYVYINNNGNIELDVSQNDHEWDVIMIDDEVTLFSKKYYLGVNDNGMPCSEPYMKRWKFIKSGVYFYIVYPERKGNNILSIKNKNSVCLSSEKNGNSKFIFVDTLPVKNPIN